MPDNATVSGPTVVIDPNASPTPHAGLGCPDVEALLTDANSEIERLMTMLSAAQDKLNARGQALEDVRADNEVALDEIEQSRNSRTVPQGAVVEVILTRADIDRIVAEEFAGERSYSAEVVDVAVRGDRLQNDITEYVRDQVLLALAVARDTGR